MNNEFRVHEAPSDSLAPVSLRKISSRLERRISIVPYSTHSCFKIERISSTLSLKSILTAISPLPSRWALKPFSRKTSTVPLDLQSLIRSTLPSPCLLINSYVFMKFHKLFVMNIHRRLYKLFGLNSNF